MREFPNNIFDLLLILGYMWLFLIPIIIIGLDIMPWILGTTISIWPVFPDISLNFHVTSFFVIMVSVIIGGIILYNKYKNKKIIVLLLIIVILLSYLIISDLTVVNNVTVSKEGNLYTVNYDSFSFGGNYHYVDIRYYNENFGNVELIDIPSAGGAYKDNGQIEFNSVDNINIIFENDISHLYGWDSDSITYVN